MFAILQSAAHDPDPPHPFHETRRVGGFLLPPVATAAVFGGALGPAGPLTVETFRRALNIATSVGSRLRFLQFFNAKFKMIVCYGIVI